MIIINGQISIKSNKWSHDKDENTEDFKYA